MGLNASKEASNGGFKKSDPIEEGNYSGRTVQVLDLGLQPQRPYQGQDKPPAHEVMLTYELGTEFLKDDDGNDIPDKPRWISETMPLRNLEQDLAKSTKRAKVLDPSNKFGGDFAQMTNLACTITVVQNPNKQDPTKVYTNVANVTPPMKGFPVPELVNPPKVFDLDEPDMEIFGSLPEWLQKKLKANLNFNGSKLQALLGGGVATEKEPEPKEAPAEDKKDDDNPW